MTELNVERARERARENWFTISFLPNHILLLIISPHQTEN